MERLGEVRSLIPEHVRIMALTATATESLRASVIDMLGMTRPVVISLSPCKKNLIYRVGKFTSISETFKPLLDTLIKDRRTCPQNNCILAIHTLCVLIYTCIYLTA